MRAETGPIGGNLSHEFIILASTGESEVFCHKDYLDMAVPGADVDFDNVAGLQGIVEKWTSHYAATSDMHDADAFARIEPHNQVSARGIEVGHIFYFGTKYSAPMKAVVAGPDGKEVPVHGGSYGIGPSRLAAAIIEASHDDAGIIWPEAVAPFKVAILNLKQGASDTDPACEQLYRELTAKGVEVLYDDRDERAGNKFATADLIGMPCQVMVGPRGLAEGKVEVKKRADGSQGTDVAGRGARFADPLTLGRRPEKLKKISAGLSIRPGLVRRCVREALSRLQEPEEMIRCA